MENFHFIKAEHKEWVEEMKSKGSAVRERYEELTTEFASVLN